jgi:hypothetical protein
MNPRIKQLANKALKHPDTDSDGLTVFDNDELGKFAELIVKEMLVTCKEHPAWTGRMIGEQIKEHFGVEE